MNDLQFTIIYGSLIIMLLITVYCLLCVPATRTRTRKRSGPSLYEFYRNMRHEREKDLEEEYQRRLRQYSLFFSILLLLCR